jgi:RHS repeat-associated protein
VGARTSQTDALGSLTTTTFDDHGRPATWTDASGGVWQTTYDAVGRALTSTDPTGVVTSYAWDAAGQLVGLSYSDGTPSVAWAYDADGRRAAMTDGTGTTTYAWDGRSRPTSITDGAGRTVGYAWDPASRLVRLTYPDGSVVERSFDVLGRLVALTDGAGHRSTFAYDAVGNLVDEQLGNGVATAQAWDAVGRLSSLDTTRAGAPLASFAGQRDASGSYASLVDDGVARAVEHDAVGRLAAVGAESFAFDAGGNVTSLRDATLAYDAGGRLASMTSDDGATSYGFDASGRRTSATSGPATTRLGYDGAGRLVSVDDPASGTDATWGYDGDGLRVSLDDPGADEHASFVWGHGAGGSELLDDGSVRFVYGPGGLPIEQVARDGTATWIHADLTGSVRALTDETGAVVATFDWDAFGMPVASTGSATTRLGFHGDWTDPGTGLQYLHARVYDPTTGQFLTIDPAVTSTHHAYAFAAGDPLAFADPTGTDPAPAAGPRLDTKGKTKNYALAGHGTWEAKDGYTVVPTGTTLLFFAPPGAPISDALGRSIEANKGTGRWRDEYPPGARVPNYTLWYPKGLEILPTSAIVRGAGPESRLRLDQLLKPNQGSLRWAACRSSAPDHGTEGKQTFQVITGHVQVVPWDVSGAAWGETGYGKTPALTPDPAWYDWDSGQFARGV